MTTSGLPRYLAENPGADFVAAFILALVFVAFIYPFSKDIAEKIMNVAFFSLIVGVILQVLSFKRRPVDALEARSK
jgi:Na+/H+-dicarboxylate symporter